MENWHAFWLEILDYFFLFFRLQNVFFLHVGYDDVGYDDVNDDDDDKDDVRW